MVIKLTEIADVVQVVPRAATLEISQNPFTHVINLLCKPHLIPEAFR